jgi:hypothetical protein
MSTNQLQVNPQQQPSNQPRPANGQAQGETLEAKVARLQRELEEAKLSAIKGGNCLMRREGNMLHITVDLSQTVGLSRSQKSTVIATTAGNKEIGDGIKVGLNVYRS